MNTQHKLIKAHKRARKLAAKLNRMEKKNVFRDRIRMRIRQLTKFNPGAAYITVLG